MKRNIKNKEVMKRLAHNLVLLRHKHGLSQKQVAEELGYERSAVTYWEMGRTNPNLDTLITICEFYKITPNDILFNLQF